MTNPPSPFRPATDDDAEGLAHLERAAFGGHAWSRAALDAKIRDSRRSTERSGVLVRVAVDLRAYAAFQWVLDEAELLRVAVHTDARRHGLARDLLDDAFQRLRERGIASCHLEVRSDNGAAIGLYRRLGFEVAGMRRAYYRDGCDAALFRLVLAH